MVKFLKIEKKDALNTGREKLNNAIDGSEESVNRSIDADNKATQSLAKSESTQTQLDTIVINGDSSVEAAQARVDEKGETHSTLKARIDDGFEKTSSQLAQIAVNVKNFGAIGDGVADDTQAFENAIELAGEGGSIFVPKGTYITDRLYLKNSQVFYGVGNGSELVLKPQHIENSKDFGGVLNTSYCAGVQIRNLTIDGNKDNLTFGIATFDVECINLKNSSDSILNNLTLKNAYDSGIDLDECDNININNVIGVDCGGYAVHMSTDTKKSTVTNSLAINCGHFNERGGFDCHKGATRNTYDNCKAVDCYIGFHLKGERNNVLNCSSENSSEEGLLIVEAKNIVSNFKTYNSVKTGVVLESDDNILMNLEVDTTNVDGVFIDGQRNFLSDVVVNNVLEIAINVVNSSNSFERVIVFGGDVGVLLDVLSRNTQMSNIRVRESDVGIKIMSDYNDINVCEVRRADTNAIRIEGDFNNLSNVKCARGSAGNSITFVGSDNCISNSDIEGEGQAGIRTLEDANNIIISGLNIRGFSNRPIRMSGDNSIVSNCVFEGSVNNEGASNLLVNNIIK